MPASAPKYTTGVLENYFMVLFSRLLPVTGAANLLTFDAAVRVHYALKITTIK